jgi:SAM-dependent methyltransferase
VLCGERLSVTIHQGSDRLYRTTTEKFNVARCVGCGLARLEPAPADVSPYYPDGYWHEPSRMEEIYRRFVIRDHVRFVGKAMRVLDVGSGGGLFAAELSTRNPGMTVTSLDISPRAAAVAWRRYGVPAVVTDLMSAPFAEASFDLITMFHVLEHLHDPLAYVKAARKLLAPGGRLVVQTPNLDCWQYKVFGARWSGLDIPRHLYDFRLSDLRRLLEMGGFRVVRVKHFSWRDNPAGLATTIAPALEPVARANRGASSRSVLYLALTLAVLPFTLLEALFGHGASVTIEAEAVTG